MHDPTVVFPNPPPANAYPSTMPQFQTLPPPVMPPPAPPMIAGIPTVAPRDIAIPGVPAAPSPSAMQLPAGVTCPGMFPARAKTWDFIQDRKGEPVLCITFKIRVGNDMYVDFPKPKKFFFTDTTFERTFESLGYMGWKGDDPSEFNGGAGFDLSQQEVQVTIDLGQAWTDDQGRHWPPGPEIGWINPLGGIRGKKIDEPHIKAWGQSVALRRREMLAAPSNPLDAKEKVPF